jgi:hypothetical protein
LIVASVCAAALIALPTLAFAHVERASYWPDPAPDTSVNPPAGGAVPDVRPLSTAFDSSQPGTTRVVCPQPLSGDEQQQLLAALATGPTSAETPGSAGSPGDAGYPGNSANLDRLRSKLEALRRKLKKSTGSKRTQLRKKVRKLAKRVAATQPTAPRPPTAGTPPTGPTSTTIPATLDPTLAQLVDDNPSIQRLDASIADAKANGWVLRPSQGPIQLSDQEASDLRAQNVEFLAHCQYTSIQTAVNDSGNNDRVVIMPGVYTEPASRAAPTHDPACADLREQNDEGETGALSYRYQVACPNDQNLVTIIGRAPGPAPPQPPAWDRHGIPDNGPCIRCNLQLEGSGPSPDDVVVDAGRVASGNGGPADPVKDIAIRAERADGIVIRNLVARHAAEHGIYVVETDGQRLEHFKTFYNEEYGVLTFTADHALMQDCEAVGSGDAGLYPGSAADTGEQTIEPTQRLGNEIRRCDMHHNTVGYSGTAANAVWVHHNDFYGNALGLVTDVITAPGHPGYPQDSDLIEQNEFYSNNFNPYVEQPADTEVVPTIPIPVGTAMWILGGNNNEFRNNYVWDNWRRGVMLASVPDALVCGDNPIAGGNQQAGCNPAAPPLPISTSYRNRFHDNVMGRSPQGDVAPNGNGDVLAGQTDFWWDQYVGSNTNCWNDNLGKDGTAASLTTTPPAPFLPSSCDPLLSTGTGGALQTTEMYSCLLPYGIDRENPPDVIPCPWFTTPPKP